MELSKLDLHLLYKNKTGNNRPSEIDYIEELENNLKLIEKDDYELPYEINKNCLSKIKEYIYFLENEINQ